MTDEKDTTVQAAQTVTYDDAAEEAKYLERRQRQISQRRMGRSVAFPLTVSKDMYRWEISWRLSPRFAGKGRTASIP